MKSNFAVGCCLIALASVVAGEDDFCTIGDYTVVRTEARSLVPFAGHRELKIIPGSFGDPHGRDFVAQGRLFGSERVLYWFLRLEKDVPVYKRAVPFPDGPDPQGPRPVLVDIDGDGVEDALSADWSYHGARKGYPWAGTSPWQDTPSLYSGVARGYDIFGRWFGFECIAEVFWAKGKKGMDGKVTLGERRNILMETPGFEDVKGVKRALVWKMFHGLGAACTLKTKSGRWLVLQGDIDALVALPMRFLDGEVYCGEVRPLLKDGIRMKHGYLTHGLYAVFLS